MYCCTLSKLNKYVEATGLPIREKSSSPKSANSKREQMWHQNIRRKWCQKKKMVLCQIFKKSQRNLQEIISEVSALLEKQHYVINILWIIKSNVRLITWRKKVKPLLFSINHCSLLSPKKKKPLQSILFGSKDISISRWINIYVLLFYHPCIPIIFDLFYHPSFHHPHAGCLKNWRIAFTAFKFSFNWCSN